MTPVEQFTGRYHADRATELLEMALTVMSDQSMPLKERTLELHRLLERIAGHQAAIELAVESQP